MIREELTSSTSQADLRLLIAIGVIVTALLLNLHVAGPAFNRESLHGPPTLTRYQDVTPLGSA